MNTKKVKLFVSTSGLVADVFRYGPEALGLFRKDVLFFIDMRLIGYGFDLIYKPVDIRVEEIGYDVLENRWMDLQEILQQAHYEDRVQDKIGPCQESDEEWGDAGLLRQFLRSHGLPFEWIGCDAFSFPGQIDYRELRAMWKLDRFHALKEIDLRIDHELTPLFQPGDRLENVPREGARIVSSDGTVRRTMPTAQGEALLRAVLTRR